MHRSAPFQRAHVQYPWRSHRPRPRPGRRHRGDPQCASRRGAPPGGRSQPGPDRVHEPACDVGGGARNVGLLPGERPQQRHLDPVSRDGMEQHGAPPVAGQGGTPAGVCVRARRGPAGACVQHPPRSHLGRPTTGADPGGQEPGCALRRRADDPRWRLERDSGGPRADHASERRQRRVACRGGRVGQHRARPTIPGGGSTTCCTTPGSRRTQVRSCRRAHPITPRFA